MFSSYFYNRLFRKYLILFGSVFSNISVRRMNADRTLENERIKVPIIWAAKEKFIQKNANESETPTVQTVLPRMAFELIGIQYDPTRKQQNLQRHATLNTTDNSVVWATYQPAPYNLDFKLTIRTRYIDDMFQIIEQIIPYFQPDYTPTANLVENLQIPKDIRITLRSADPEFAYEGVLGDETRDVTCTMLFTMQAFFFGPIELGKVITKVIANVYVDRTGPVLINVGDGSGNYPDGDLVYQGNNVNFAEASGIVRNVYFQGNTKQLLIEMRSGEFSANSAIRSSTGNGHYIMTSFADPNSPVITFTVTPSPLTANADSDFGINIVGELFD
jgi:hypothetical protein